MTINKDHVTVLLSIIVLTLGFAPVSANAGAEDDAARIERKFEIRKMAKEVLERVEKRTTEAAEHSKTIQENNDKMFKQLNECTKISDQALNEYKKTSPSLLKEKLLKQSKLALSTEPDGCIGNAISINPNAEILDELREEFITEELDHLRDTLEEPQRKEIEQEIRELSA